MSRNGVDLVAFAYIPYVHNMVITASGHMVTAGKDKKIKMCTGLYRKCIFKKKLLRTSGVNVSILCSLITFILLH